MQFAHVAPLGLMGWFYNVFYTHIAPLGLMGWFYNVFYTHIAPLGLCETSIDWFICAINELLNSMGAGDGGYSILL